MGRYVQNLIVRVINASEADTWENAVQEWEIVDCEEDEDLSESCVCGKEELRYLFTIRNVYNGNLLFPIGSSCIKKFGRSDLKEDAQVREGMFKLLHAVENNDFIELSTDLFTRKVIRALYEDGAFDSQYNNFDGEGDYDFFLKMFNKRDKSSITLKQHKKIRAIIVASIRPYLEDKLQDKVHRRDC